MHAKVFSASLRGLDAFLVEIEASAMKGSLPLLNIVGLPDQAVNESKERITAALKNSGFKPPHHFSLRITVNLAPADIRKEGPSFDLPIAIAVLAATRQIKPPSDNIIFAGELALNGDLRRIKGVISLALLARKLRKEIVIPYTNKIEAILAKKTGIMPVKNLKQLVKHISGAEIIDFNFGRKIKNLNRKTIQSDFLLDSIKGQDFAKRALLIAAAGEHNILMVGPPGSGKTVLAKSLIELLPPLDKKEALEAMKVFSVSGAFNFNKFSFQRPFRSPHHSASASAVLGGGTKLRPGEITLAHRGVLFLDELPEFQRPILEGLREPLEEGNITIARARDSAEYPARFMLVAAMNPCPCGYLTDQEKDCRCSAGQVMMYRRKISGPFLDRFDLIVEVGRVKLREIMESEKQSLNGKIWKEKILLARKQQQGRLRLCAYKTNSNIPLKQIEKIINLNSGDKEFLLTTIDRLGLSMRAYHKILRVARTIADLENSDAIKKEYLLEALQYRQRQEI